MEDYLVAARRRAAEMDEDRSGAPPFTSQQAFLDNAQTAWKAYSRIVCDGVWDRWSEGTVRAAMIARCQIRMTHERTQVIWRDFLTYADSTPPILPEPRREVSASTRPPEASVALR